jgi:branched-chain amino acid transport system permease protein
LAVIGVCAVVGVLVALPSLRLSGIYFALATAAFATAMDAWVFPLPAFNLFGTQFAPFGTGSLTFGQFRVGGLAVDSNRTEFVVGAVVFMLLVGVVVLIRRSEFGSQLFAFKDSPAACATLGMNTRVLPIAVFAVSAAIAGVGGAVYGQALGSAAPDIFQFFGGLSVLLTMVIYGIGAVGSGVGTGLFLGGPTLTNFFPGLLQLQTVLVGGTAIGVGTSPNGLIPSGLRPVWESVARRRVLLVAIVAAVVALWALAYSGVIGNWTMVWCLLAVVVVAPFVPYLIDYQRGDAAPAFGIPDRRSTPAPASVSAIRLPAPVGVSASPGESAVTSLGSEP